MTKDEWTKILENLKDIAVGLNDAQMQSFRYAYKALEKQIPKPPTVPSDKQEPCSCPRCEYRHIIGNKYCPNCGQRIDWSGEE